MKKLLLSAILSVPLMFMSCEKEKETDPDNDNQNNQTQDDGFWKLDCYYTTDSVVTTYCDSIWVGDSTNQGYYETVCDSVWVTDSVWTTDPNSQGQGHFEVECEVVWVSNNNQWGQNSNGYWKQDCQTGFELVTIETCDSVWVDNSDNGNQTDSTDNSNWNNQNGSKN